MKEVTRLRMTTHPIEVGDVLQLVRVRPRRHETLGRVTAVTLPSPRFVEAGRR